MDERRKADRRTQDRLLTESQVADMVSVPLRTVRHWRQSGVLPSIKIGRHPRVWLSVIYQVFQRPFSGMGLDFSGNPATINNAGDIRRAK